MKVVKKVTSSDGTSIALGRAGTGVASSSRRSIGAAGLVAGCSTPSMPSWRALGDADRDDPDRQPAPSFQVGTVSHSPAVVMTYGTLRTRLIVRTAAGHVSSGSALDTPNHPLMTCSFPRGAVRTRTCDRRIMSPPSPAGGCVDDLEQALSRRRRARRLLPALLTCRGTRFRGVGCENRERAVPIGRLDIPSISLTHADQPVTPAGPRPAIGEHGVRDGELDRRVAERKLDPGARSSFRAGTPSSWGDCRPPPSPSSSPSRTLVTSDIVGHIESGGARDSGLRVGLGTSDIPVFGHIDRATGP